MVEISPLASALSDLSRIAETLDQHPHVLVISGAGMSTASGISDYRDKSGAWKRPQPVQHQAFVQHLHWRQRYWARSQLGYPIFAQAQPNDGHRSLAALEQRGLVFGLITQNVDRLHQRAGQQQVLDLHGRLDQVRCIDCNYRSARSVVQDWLQQENPWISTEHVIPAPDGDADIELDFNRVKVPECPCCGGILKPDVVFFGDAVPKTDVAQGYRWVENAQAVLVVGTSLMVYSSFRFVRKAYELGLPVMAINQGKTRGDELFAVKADINCVQGLAALVDC